MTTMDGVPLPPRTVGETTNPANVWKQAGRVIGAVLTAILVIIPIVAAWVAGMAVRAAALIVAASIEGYKVGRGISDDDGATPSAVVTPISTVPNKPVPMPPHMAALQVARKANPA